MMVTMATGELLLQKGRAAFTLTPLNRILPSLSAVLCVSRRASRIRLKYHKKRRRQQKQNTEMNFSARHLVAFCFRIKFVDAAMTDDQPQQTNVCQFHISSKMSRNRLSLSKAD